MVKMHPADHVKLSAHDDFDPGEELGPSRALYTGMQRNLLHDSQNFDDTPISDGPFLHKALDRRPGEFVYGAPAGERMHPIDHPTAERWNSPAWFQMIGVR